MGKVFSSTKDYNRTLAKQPLKPIGLSKFDISNVEQQPLTGTLSIPYPVRISTSTEKGLDTVNQLLPINFDPTINESIQSQNLSPNLEYIREQESPIIQSRSGSTRSYISQRNQTMNTDPVIVRRSVINLNKHRRTENNQLASYTSRPTIVERNGKQFVTQTKERLERRYVQIFDEMTGGMRLFEVTDYIPTRTVTSVRNSPQLPVHNNATRHSFSTRSSFNQHSPSRNILNSRPELTIPSNLVNFKDLNNGESVAREFDLYHSGANLPVSINNNNNSYSSVPLPITSQTSGDSSYTNSESKAYNSSTTPSRNAYNQYSSNSYQSEVRSFRPHSPTASDYSVSTRTERSTDDNSDKESINRVLTPTHHRSSSHRNNSGISYETMGGQSVSSDPDPFARTIQPGDHPYTQRPGVNNYSEPMAIKQGFPRTGNPDYAPLATAPNHANRNRRKSSNTYET
ncbi:hypothetical protein I4U23_014656 [Adineta vaga]|nr:hypothetical protein I4U23_014656 [Adineta vaga]